MKVLLKVLLITSLLLSFSCQEDTSPTETNVPTLNTDDPEAPSQDPLEYVELITPDEEVIEASLVYTPQELTQGLSGLQPEEFDNDDGMLFFYLNNATRTFWMPDTYFNLDIIYLDENLKVLEIVWDLPHYIGRANLQDVPRAPAIRSRHVLEMKAESEIPETLRVGDYLRWRSPWTLQQTESEIRQLL